MSSGGGVTRVTRARNPATVERASASDEWREPSRPSLTSTMRLMRLEPAPASAARPVESPPAMLVPPSARSSWMRLSRLARTSPTRASGCTSSLELE